MTFAYRFLRIMTAHEYIHEGIFEFEAGGSITGLKVAYHTSEKPWQKGDSRKVIWLCHALTANSDAQDWCFAVQMGRFQLRNIL